MQSPEELCEQMVVFQGISVTSGSSISLQYRDWIERFKNLLITYKQGYIEIHNLEKFQLFLLETGQFNANFTLEELRRLRYPMTPFSILNNHTYLRATDTWAMQILRLDYLQKNSGRLFPIWLDSALFWLELERYCRVIELKKLQESDLLMIVNESLCKGEHIWIPLSKEEHENIGIIKNSIGISLKKTILENKEINIELINFFIDVCNGKRVKDYISEQFLSTLDTFFPEEKAKHNEKIQEELKFFTDVEVCGISQCKKIFGLAKKYKCLVEAKTPEELSQYAMQRKEEFVKLLSIIKDNIELETPAASLYIESAKQWLAKNIDPLVKSFFDNVVFYFQDNFNGIDAIVFCDCNSIPEFVNSVIGNLGYRVDPVKIIRLALKAYPNLFVDYSQTKNFWEQLMRIPIINSLPEVEKNNIDKIRSYILEEISNVSKKSFETVTTNEALIFFKELQQLEILLKSSQFQVAFNLYGRYMFFYLNGVFSRHLVHDGFRRMVGMEIQQTLNIFLKACNINNLSMAIRQVQTISEIMLLELELAPIIKPLPLIISERLLERNYPVQDVLIIPYAMRAFVRVFQILNPNLKKEVSFNISATNQSYFEWLYNLEKLHENGITVYLIRHLNELSPNSDVIFAEIHPNNVVESKQFAHDVTGFLRQMVNWPKKKRTLVIDVTLNFLNDEEVINLLNGATTFINEGWLNIILIQSLTKFAQLGLDKRSAGSFIVINNNRDWLEVNSKLSELAMKETADPSTVNFFSYFALHPQLMQDYIEIVNRNVRNFYKQVVEQLNSLEVINKGRFQITMSIDPKACYVALNMKGLISDDENFTLSLEVVENLSSDILANLIYPLCKFFDLPLTERMSIGFPLSSINCVYDSMRLTIGLESDEQLQLYAEIFAYVSFVLNRQRNRNLFFDTTARHIYFAEKVEQFKAMTPAKSCNYTFEFDTNDPYNSYTNYVTMQSRQLKRRVSISNGNLIMWREIAKSQYGAWSFPHCQDAVEATDETVFYPYIGNRIKIQMREIGNVGLFDPKVSIATRRMGVACLNTYIYQKQDNDDRQNVNLLFDNRSHTVNLVSMEMLGSWNINAIYGPFSLNGKEVFFHLHQKNICCLFQGEIYTEEAILVKQGNIVISLTDMLVEDRGFIFREGFYEPTRTITTFPYRAFGLSVSPDIQYIPKDNSWKLSIENGKLTIENDLLCCNKAGVTVYKRLLGNNEIVVSIDFWGEKDPILARFMRLITAVYIKEKQATGFLAYNKQFSQFLFCLSCDDVNMGFSRAIDIILYKKFLIKQLVLSSNAENLQQYSFNGSNLAWPSGHSGINYTQNKNLIDQAVNILMQESFEIDLLNFSRLSIGEDEGKQPDLKKPRYEQDVLLRRSTLKPSSLPTGRELEDQCSTMTLTSKQAKLGIYGSSSIEEYEWFNDDEMNKLFPYYFDRDNICLIDAIDAYQHHGETLRQNLEDNLIQQVFAESSTGLVRNMMILPVNLGNMHWSALYIYFNSENRMAPMIGYFDPFGHAMPEILGEVLLKVFTQLDMSSMLISPIRLQEDDYNCGPWVITILQSLVDSHGLHLPPEYFNIQAARRQYLAVLSNLSVTQVKLHQPKLILTAKSLSQKQKEIRFGLFKGKQSREDIEKYLGDHTFASGSAIDEGDCFFDSITQLLNSSQKNLNCKEIRMICDKYIKGTNGNNDWVEEAMNRDADHGGQDYRTCLATIQFTSAEMKTMKKEKNLFDGLATWGRPHIEGRIVCSVLNVKLHVVEFQEDKSVPEGHLLVDNQSCKTIDAHDVDYDCELIVHLAVYHGHFVPLFKAEKLQNEQVVSNKYSLQKQNILSLEVKEEHYRFEDVAFKDFQQLNLLQYTAVRTTTVPEEEIDGTDFLIGEDEAGKNSCEEEVDFLATRARTSPNPSL